MVWKVDFYARMFDDRVFKKRCITRNSSFLLPDLFPLSSFGSFFIHQLGIAQVRTRHKIRERFCLQTNRIFNSHMHSRIGKFHWRKLFRVCFASCLFLCQSFFERWQTQGEDYTALTRRQWRKQTDKISNQEFWRQQFWIKPENWRASRICEWGCLYCSLSGSFLVVLLTTRWWILVMTDGLVLDF